MSFKVGQKVRVIEWVDMLEIVQESYSKNTLRIGEIGVVKKIIGEECNITCYDILFNGDKYPIFLFEKELEPIIKVGEQLMFSFMEKE